MTNRSLTLLLVLVLAAVAAALGLRFIGEAEPATEASSPSSSRAPDPEASSTTPPAPAEPTESSTTTIAATTSTLAPGATACDRYEGIETIGTVQNPALTEISGVAAGRINPGVLWVHNDSQDGPIVYAIDTTGQSVGTYQLDGAFAFDWEDMAAGPGPVEDVSYLYLGDIGDNFEIRGGSITLYRVPEPAVATSGDVLSDVEAIPLRYPDGSPNAEAMFIDPVDSALYIVTRDTEVTRVYRADGSAGGTEQTMEPVATLDLGHEVTGADIAHDGSVIALRGEEHVRLFHRPAAASIAEALSGEPCSAPAPDEIQGEALAFLSDGAYVTLSEDIGSPIHRVP